MIGNPPCHKCVERHVGCHVDCERFDGWRAMNEEAAKEGFKKRDVDCYIANTKVKRYSQFYMGTGKNIKIKTV